MAILVANSDFERIWGEPEPTIAFDNVSYSLAGEVETDLTATFSITDNNEEDVTDQCTITFNNEYVTVEENEGVYSFNCEGLEVGTYETTVTATYSYLSATVTATATINISVTEKQPTSISFDNSSYTMNGNEYATLTKAFTVTDDLDNDVTALCSYAFSPNDKGLYAEGGYFKVDSATAGIYSITVTATYGQLTNTATISMAVVDYPDSISFDSNSYSMSGTEGDTITQAFTVTDDLSHDVTANCTISFSPNNTGLTASNGAFDASAVAEGTYSVTATATYQSGNGRTLTTTATISMEIESASFADKYLTFEALESGTFTLNVPTTVTSSKMTSVSYSTDNGTTWVDTTIDSTNQNITTPTINAGDKVIWKGVGSALYGSSFKSTGNFNASGNIMSLLYGDNFVGQTNATEAAFCRLFMSNTKIVSAGDLVLPATTVGNGCYQQMFAFCTSLTTAPKELSATTLAEGCCFQMFWQCTSMTTAPAILPATTLATKCYQSMFLECSSLTTAPELPATTLATYCYQSMFKGCTSLTTAPELPATRLQPYCYGGHSGGVQTSYDGMFAGCTSLTTAPELPATRLVDYCYSGMFAGCTNLNNIKMLATDNITANDCLWNWVKDVAASGTFTKAAAMTTLPSGINGIPSGWAVVDAQ